MRGPVPGWKAGLVIIGALVVVFAVANLVGRRLSPAPRRTPPPPVVIPPSGR